MLITVSKNISLEDLGNLESYLNKFGLVLELIGNSSDLLYKVKGDTYRIDEQSILTQNGVKSIKRITPLYYHASRMYRNQNTIVDVDGVKFGDRSLVFIAGPCSVESPNQIDSIASICKMSGAKLLRGGAFKPRTSPYFFQGLGYEGIDILKDTGLRYNMPTVSEIVSVDQLDYFVNNVSLIQVGARNMQNYELLKALGKTKKPILLKRGISATIEEWLLSAEYILSYGNPNVILCERGIRTFEKSTRFTLDLSSISVVKQLSHLPVIVDPSHASGDYSFVSEMTLASVACGCDGIIIEVHNDPKHALSDGKQALKASKLASLINKCNKIKEVIGEDDEL